jgi:hypothetical protein
MTVYAVAQLRFTDREAYDRYQAGFLTFLAGRQVASWQPMTIQPSLRARLIATKS